VKKKTGANTSNSVKELLGNSLITLKENNELKPTTKLVADLLNRINEEPNTSKESNDADDHEDDSSSSDSEEDKKREEEIKRKEKRS